MKIKRSLMLLFMFFVLLVKGQTFQNLVPNGSFETFTNCPTADGQIYSAPPWTGPTINSSDFYNACANNVNVPHYGGISNPYYYLEAKDGNGYAGVWWYQLNNFREYLQVKLVDSLYIGNCYYVEFYATNGQYIKYKTNNIAASFTNTNFPTNQSFPGTLLQLPLYITNYGNTVLRDTVKWERIAGIYQAVANDKFLILGNFKDDSNTDTINIYQPGQAPYYTSDAYVFIDAVSVFSINPTGNLPWKYRDTTIVEGDSVYIGNTMGGNFNSQWFTIGGNYITTNAGIYVKPVSTTSYVVNYTVCGTPRADTLEVKVVSDIGIGKKLLNELEFKVFPNPANDEIEIICEEDFTKPKQLRITDVLGKEVYHSFLHNKKQKFDVSNLQNGVYFITIKGSTGESITKKIIVSK